MLIKNLLKRKITEFIPLEFGTNEIREQVFWGEEDISDRLTLFALEPILFGIWYPGQVQNEMLKFTIKLNDEILVEIYGSYEKTIQLNGGSLILWKPQSTKLLAMNLNERFVELAWMLRQSRKSKFRFSKKSIMHIAAAYYFPRKIYIVVVKANHFLNIFPMDLHMKYPGKELYAFALQPDNSSESVIKECGKIVVCEIPSDKLGVAYKLGKNHGKTNLYGQELPFEVEKSQQFGFPIPKFSIGYKEIQINDSLSLGSHTLFLGKVLSRKDAAGYIKQPYHVHRFHFRYCISKNILNHSAKLKIS